jgi:hypothetical protein
MLEIAPGRLRDGSVVDGAPCTSTSPPGLWRLFPYLAELEGGDTEALWGYLCTQWDTEKDVTSNPPVEFFHVAS